MDVNESFCKDVWGVFTLFTLFQWFLIVQKVISGAKNLFVKVPRLVRVFIDYSTCVLFLEGDGK